LPEAALERAARSRPGGRATRGPDRRPGRRRDVGAHCRAPPPTRFIAGRTAMLHWLCLAGAIVLEVAGTTSMKLSQGFTRPLPSVLLFVFYAASFALMTIAVKRIDMSVSYAIWSGVGTALIALIGFGWFREPLTTLKVASMLLIVIGVIGLNLDSWRSPG
jgi:small multidrug resistance pump